MDEGFLLMADESAFDGLTSTEYDIDIVGVDVPQPIC